MPTTTLNKSEKRIIDWTNSRPEEVTLEYRNEMQTAENSSFVCFEDYKKNMIVAYTTAGMPLTQKQYIEKIEKAMEEADKGELITDEDLEKEIATW